MRTPRSRISGAYFGCAFFFTLLSGFKLPITSFSQRLRSPKNPGRFTGVARLYLLCFAYDRFRQVNDHLIEAFIRLVNDYEQTCGQSSAQALRVDWRTDIGRLVPISHATSSG